MKDLKHIKRFNESDENLNISDVSESEKIEEGWYWILPINSDEPIPCYYLPDYDGFIIGGIDNAKYIADVIKIDYYEHEIKKIGKKIMPIF